MNSLIDEIRRPLTDEPDWWVAMKTYPFLLYDQHFGYELLEQDLDPTYISSEHMLCPRAKAMVESRTGYSSVEITGQEFKIILCTTQFHSEELEVKVVKGFVVVSGVHGEDADASGTSIRGFTRRYMLPHDCSGRNITVKYSPADSELYITVRRGDVFDTKMAVAKI